MKLMIEIDNSIYDICKSVRNLPLDENDIMSSLIIQSIANGTPLEKHDAISRQAVLNYTDKILNCGMGKKKSFEFIHKFVEKLPSATSQSKTGRWINGDDKCPCCGKSKFEGLDADIWADWQPKYCPNCGKKMNEPPESEV